MGSLLVLDAHGNVLHELHSHAFLDGPWDLTLSDGGNTASVFVSNVLNGTVSRIDLAVSPTGVKVLGMTRIASGYVHRCDPAALVVGPTGLALDSSTETLYVASTGDNAIFAVPDAFGSVDRGTGSLFIDDSVHLHGPLGLVRAANGDLVSSQGDAVNPPDSAHFSEIVEYDSTGAFVDQHQVDPAVGSAFGIALSQSGSSFVFAAVDDGMNTLDIWNVP
jgi:DNA-binding beta-propeller fold protein YncE